MSLAPGARLGVYEVVSPLGAGAMGEVWRARDTRLGREVALKVLPASLSGDHDRLQRFEREAQVLASLNHPNIGSIYGVEEAGGATALVLELVEGPTLDERLRTGRLPVEDVVAMARQIAEALEYAHEHGVVHRDLKPANIKIAPDGRVKVLDFGLAKAIAADPSGRSDSAVSPTITSLGTIAGVVLGTAAYMAPEQARGTNVDRRADIWAFGVVLWEMLAGKRLFDEATVSDTLAAVLRAPIEWDELPSGTPPGLIRLLRRCLERDPKRRLRDIGEARIALENPQLALEPEPAAPPPSLTVTSKRSIVPWALLCVASVALVAALGFLLLRKTDPSPVVQFQIAADPRLSVATWPRVSPDGLKIAFIGRDAAGKSSIWLRSLDAVTASLMPGTEGGGRFWWSPDSRYVAFFAGRELKKVPVSGGPAQLIASTDGGADGTWGSGGTILFDSRAIDPIKGVSASGGVVTQVTRADSSSADAGQSWPFFLPDGKHFLFVGLAKGANARSSIRVGALGETATSMLGPTDSRVEYAGGKIFYILQGTLVAQSFDPKTLKLSGEAVPIAEHVGTDLNGAGVFSVSERVLIYAQGGTGTNTELVWVDRSGRDLGKIAEPAPYRDLALSPDESRLAYGLGDPRSGAEDIWVRDLKREVASRLTFDPGNDVAPVWSPDGTRIVFASNRSGHYALMTKDARGTAAETSLYLREDLELTPDDWSKDGRWIAVRTLPASRRAQIQMLPAQGEPKPVDYLVEDVVQRGAAFSPDGRFVAYASNESGRPEVYVQAYPKSGGKWQISSTGGQDPQWRADGKELFFRGLGDEFYAVPVALGTEFEPGVPAVLFRRSVDISGLPRKRWLSARDGQKFLINTTGLAGTSPPFNVVLSWPETLATK